MENSQISELKENSDTRKQIERDYEILEPGTTDSWNPAFLESEQFYRIGLYYALAQALGRSNIPIDKFRILDLGCGNGRSTRILLDFGLKPDQLSGLDLRSGAIQRAKQLCPTIDYQVYDGNLIPYPDRFFNWIQLTTVLSSIKDPSHRKNLVNSALKKLKKNGFLFYYDIVTANDFAGGDIIDPMSLFGDLQLKWQYQINTWQLQQELNASELNRFHLNYCRLKLSFLPIPPTHEAYLVQKS